MNKVIMLGNLTRDPQTKSVPSGTTVTEFGIANNRKFKTAAGEQREEVCFLDCAAWGKTGELIAQHFRKGKQILVEGRLKQDTWEDKNGGGKRSKHVLNVDGFSFTGSKSDGGGNADDAGEQAPAQRSAGGGSRPQREAVAAPFGDEQQFREDDIPFAFPVPVRHPL